MRAIRKSFLFGMAFALFYSLIYGAAGVWLAGLFTNDPELVESTKPFLIWIIIMPMLSTPSYIWDGIYIGLTASRAMRNSMTLAFAVFILLWYFSQPLVNHGLWMSLLGLMIARAIFQHYLFYRKKWSLT